MQDRKVEILTKIFGTPTIRATEHLFKCPKCSSNKRKLSINFEKNKFKCWVCEYYGKDIYRIVKRYGNFLQKMEWESVENIPSSQGIDHLIDKLNGVSPKKQKQILNLPKEFISLGNGNTTTLSARPRNYLKNKRRINDKQIVQNRMGYCLSGEYSNRIVIPSFDDEGDLNYFSARTYDNNYIKYLNPTASKDIIFNDLYIDWTREIVLVEGAFDAIGVRNAIPLLGSILSKNSKLTQKIRKTDVPVCVALDHDAEKKSLKIVESMLEYDIEVRKMDTSGYEDVATMPISIFEERRSALATLDHDALFRLKISNANSSL